MEEHTSPGMKETSLGRESREIMAAPALNLQWRLGLIRCSPGEEKEEVTFQLQR